MEGSWEEMEGGGGTKGRREKGVKGETLSDQIFALCSRAFIHNFLSGCCSTHRILHHYCDAISDSIMEDNFGLLSVLLSCHLTICEVFIYNVTTITVDNDSCQIMNISR